MAPADLTTLLALPVSLSTLAAALLTVLVAVLSLHAYRAHCEFANEESR